MQDTTAVRILDRLSDLENYSHESLAPYEEFRVGSKTYYFTPGGFLYGKEPGTEDVGASFVATLRTRHSTTGLTMGRLSITMWLRSLATG